MARSSRGSGTSSSVGVGGRRILFAPIVVLAVVARVVLVTTPDRAELVGELLTPDALEALVVVVVAVGSVPPGGARRDIRPRRAGAAGRPAWIALGRAFLTALLAIAIVAPHIIVGAVIVDTRQTIMDVFDPADLGAVGDGAGDGADSELIPPLEPDDT